MFEKEIYSQQFTEMIALTEHTDTRPSCASPTQRQGTAGTERSANSHMVRKRSVPSLDTLSTRPKYLMNLGTRKKGEKEEKAKG